MSLLTFAITPVIGLKGSKTGLVGILAVATSLSCFFVAIQNEYVYSNPAIYQGLSMLGIGIAMGVAGALIYFKLFLTGELVDEKLNSSFVYKGRHCPHCGASWEDPNQQECPNCNRSLYVDQSISFCPHCGRFVNQASETCSHCGEDIASLPVHISLKSSKKKTLFSRILESLDLSTKEFIMILILLVLFNFLSYISYVRVENPPIVQAGSTIQNNYGVPLEWLQIIQVWNRRAARVPGQTEFFTTMGGVGVNWAALILDLLLYFLMAFAIVYSVARLRRGKMRIH
jgi:hypothetical protein